MAWTTRFVPRKFRHRLSHQTTPQNDAMTPEKLAEQQEEVPCLPSLNMRRGAIQSSSTKIFQGDYRSSTSGESRVIDPLPPRYSQLYPEPPDPAEMTVVVEGGPRRGERVKGRMEFEPGGQAIICCFLDVILLIGSITASAVWMTHMRIVTTFILGIDGEVFRDTIKVYSNMTGVQSKKLTDGEIRWDYVYLNCSIDLAVASVQFVAAILMILSGPMPIKHLKLGMLICCVWLLVNGSVLVGYMTWRIMDQTWLTLLVGTVVRLGFIIVVLQFMWEISRHF